MSNYYNRSLPPQYYKVGSNYENQDYAYKNVEPEKNFLNRQLIEEEKRNELQKAQQAEEFSSYARNVNQDRPSSYTFASKNNYDHLTGKIGQEQRYDMKYGIPPRVNDTVSKSYFRNPRSHLTHGYNIVNGTICNVFDNNEALNRRKDVPVSNRDSNMYYPPQSQQYQQEQGGGSIRNIMRERDEYEQKMLRRRGESCPSFDTSQARENEIKMINQQQQQMRDESERREYEQQQIRKMEYDRNAMQKEAEYKYQQEQNQLRQQQQQQTQQQQSIQGNSYEQLSEEEYKKAYEEFYRQEQAKHQSEIPEKTPIPIEETKQYQKEIRPEEMPQRNEPLPDYKKITPLTQANAQQQSNNMSIPDSEYKEYMEYMKNRENNNQLPIGNSNQQSLTPQRVINYGFIPPQKQQPSQQEQQQSLKIQPQQPMQPQQEQTQQMQQQGTNTPQISEEEYLRLKNMQQEELEYQEYKKYLQAQQPRRQYDPQMIDKRPPQRSNQQYSPYESEYINRFKNYRSTPQIEDQYSQQATGYNQDKIMKTNPYSPPQRYMNSIPLPDTKNVRSNYVTSNPYSTKSIDLGKSSLSSNPILFPVNSYKFNYDRFLNPSYSGNRLVNIGNNIVSQ